MTKTFKLFDVTIDQAPGQLSCDGQKYFVDVVRVLGGRLHKEESVFLGVTIGLLVLNGAAVGQVRLVSG